MSQQNLMIGQKNQVTQLTKAGENQHPNEFQGKTAAVPVTYSDSNDPAKACLTLTDQTMTIPHHC